MRVRVMVRWWQIRRYFRRNGMPPPLLRCPLRLRRSARTARCFTHTHTHTHDEHEKKKKKKKKSRNKNLNKPVTLRTSSIKAEGDRRTGVREGARGGEEKERRK